MTQVLFLHGVRDRLRTASAWLARHSTPDGKIAVFIPDLRQASRLDRLLWEEPHGGFLPHCYSDNPLQTQTPIVICTEILADWPSRTLLNLSNQMPANSAQIDRLVEIVSQEESVILAGRERFRAYREAGHPIETRDGEQELAQ